MAAPREIFDNPKVFGRRGDAQPAKPGEWSDQTFAAAVLQHRAAVAVTSILERRRPMSEQRWAEHAQLLGTTGSTLRRKLYGSATATLEDLTSWTLLFGVDIWPVVDSTSELLPAVNEATA